MGLLSWLASNWQSVLSIVSAALAVGVSIAHLIHKDAVADKIQAIEDSISSIVKK